MKQDVISITEILTSNVTFLVVNKFAPFKKRLDTLFSWTTLGQIDGLQSAKIHE